MSLNMLKMVVILFKEKQQESVARIDDIDKVATGDWSRDR